MAQYLTIARPYAAALFEDAKGDHALFAAWSNILEVLSYITNHPAIVRLINDPRTISLSQMIKELMNMVVCADIKAVGIKFDNFIRLLIKNKRLRAVSDILTIFKQLVDDAQNVTVVTVTSAFEIDKSIKIMIDASLAKKLRTNVSTQFDLDKSLIGGAIIRTNKFVIDGSIKGKLARLHQKLQNIKG